MANHKSALKKARQDIDRRARNRVHRSRVRTAIKKFRTMLQSGDVDGAKSSLPATLSLVDHSVKLGVLHRNAGARTKSRLTKAFQRAAS